MKTNSIDSNLLRLFSEFRGITFDSSNHRYTFPDGTIGTSVTGLIQCYSPKFDSEGISKAYAKKHNMEVNDVLSMWALKNIFATTRGTLIHQFVEDYFRGLFFDLTAKSTKDKVYKDFTESMAKKSKMDKFTFVGNVEENVDKIIIEASYLVHNHVRNYLRDSSSLVPVLIEGILGDSLIELAGSPDMLCVHPTKLINGGHPIQIFDWKTNGEIIIPDENTYNKFMIIGDYKIPANKYHTYSLQLSLYAGIMRRKSIAVSPIGWIVHFTNELDNYKVHKCVDYSEVVDWIFAEKEKQYAWKHK